MVEHSSKIHEININWNVTKLYGNERWCHDFQWSHHVVVETRWFIMIRSLGWTSDFLMKARTGQTATHGLNWQLYNATFFFTNLGQSSAALCKFSLHQMSCAPFCETVPGSVVHRRFLPVYSLAMSHFLGLLGPHFRSAPIFTWCLDPCKNGEEKSVLFSPKSNSFISRGGGGLAKYVESMANSWLGLSIARRRRDAVRARVVFQKAEFIPFIRNFPAGAFLNVLFCPYDFIMQWVYLMWI